MEDKKQIVHYLKDYLCAPTHPVTISVIGCGGTGSLLIPKLARLDFALKKLNNPGLHVTVYDGDIVEEHNCKKQNFFDYDIGDFKANNIVSKINKTYGLQWESINQFVKIDKRTENDFLKKNIVITCVDNAELRMKIKKAFSSLNQRYADYRKTYYWLDCGNGKNFGQVVLGTVGDTKETQTSEVYDLRNELNDVVDLFGDLKSSDTKEAQGMDGCSFVESLQQQDLFINDQVSNEAAKLLWTLLKNMVITFNGVIINQETGRTVPIMLK